MGGHGWAWVLRARAAPEPTFPALSLPAEAAAMDLLPSSPPLLLPSCPPGPPPLLLACPPASKASAHPPCPPVVLMSYCVCTSSTSPVSSRRRARRPTSRPPILHRASPPQAPPPCPLCPLYSLAATQPSQPARRRETLAPEASTEPSTMRCSHGEAGRLASGAMVVGLPGTWHWATKARLRLGHPMIPHPHDGADCAMEHCKHTAGDCPRQSLCTLDSSRSNSGLGLA